MGNQARMALGVVCFNLLFLLLTFSAAFSHSGHKHLTPYLPAGTRLPKVTLPAGQDPNPEGLPKDKGKVTVAFFFRMENGLRLNLKAFLTNPQDPSLHWEQREIRAEDVTAAKLPIPGSLDDGKGRITGPLMLPPAEKIYLVTLVVDNRTGKEDQRFYVPAPNPNADFLLSSDTKPEVLFKIVPMCLCASQVYTAPKGGIWYRVIGLYIAPGAPTPSRASFIMDLMKAPRAETH
jgi:hypothetical protein